MQKTVALIFSLLLWNCCSAKNRFEWTPDLRSAYQKLLNLRLTEASQELEKIHLSDPTNLLVLHVENYLDFLKVFINEDEAEFRRLEKNKDKRIERIEATGDPSSPYYLYLQADIRLQWAIARLKFDEFATAFFETNKAFKLLTKNKEKFPHFQPNNKNLGIMHAMAGTIPDSYKKAVGWVSSLEGSLDLGKKELQEVIGYAQKNDFIYEHEAYINYTYLLLNLDNDSESAWQIIQTSKLDPTASPLACFVKANVAMRTDRNATAISILEKRPTGKPYHPFHYLDYMLGVAKLQRLDPDADVYLKRFASNFKGRNFIKDAYQKLAWHALLQNDRTAFKKYMDLCKSTGYATVGSDKNALKDAKSGHEPPLELLKARLLFDGGYFEKALDALAGKKAGDYFSSANQLEFSYRKGRILHKLKRYDEALVQYQSAIDSGKDSPYYYPCRAALEKGLVLEKLGRPKEARQAFQLCLRFSPDDHKEGLHQQAKAGLKRVG